MENSMIYNNEPEQYSMWTDKEVKKLTQKAAMVGFVYGIVCTFAVAILFFIFMEGAVVFD